MNLKTQLRYYLKLQNLSVLQLAKRSGVPNATLADWLKGKMPKNLDQVKAVANVFSCSIDHLVYGDGDNDLDSQRATELNALMGENQWVGGVFEVRWRRLNRKAG